MQFRYNIAKVCKSCKSSFISNMLDEEDECLPCISGMKPQKDFDEYLDQDTKFEIDLLLNPMGNRPARYYE